MAITKYNLTAFVRDEAIAGSLCVCVSGTTVTDSVKSNDAAFVGAGIPVYKDYRFHLTVNGTPYIFDDKGEPANAAATGKKLVLGSIEKAVVGRGNVVSTYNTGDNATRGVGGYDTATATYIDSPTNVPIDSLNARDQFAVQALQTLLARMEKDPATLSDNEMVYWSDVAYKWASSMMIAAANARAKLEDDTATSDVEPAPIGELENNSEKLLNNIIYALQKTDFEEPDPDAPEPEEGEEQEMLYSERIINPKQNKLIKDYLKAIDAGTQDFAPQASTDPSDPSGTKYWDYENLLKLLWRQQYKENDVNEESNTIGEYAQRIINPKLNKALKAFLVPTADSSPTKEFLGLVEFLDLYKKFFTHTSSGPSDSQDYAAFEDLTKTLKDLQEVINGSHYERVLIKDFDTMLTKLDTMNTNLANINTSIQAFTTAMGNRFTALDNSVSNVQTDVTYIKNNMPSTNGLATSTDVSNAETNIINAMPDVSLLATSSEIDSAKDDIINAMPTCRYNPPT